jgi:hypothetical protein
MATLNKITGLVAGQYGSSIVLTAVDDEGNAIDISSYTGITIRAISPDARTTLSFTGAEVTDGTDGQFSFTPTSLNTFDRDGTWEAQAQFTASGILVLTVIFELVVEKKI